VSQMHIDFFQTPLMSCKHSESNLVGLYGTKWERLSSWRTDWATITQNYTKIMLEVLGNTRDKCFNIFKSQNTNVKK